MKAQALPGPAGAMAFVDLYWLPLGAGGGGRCVRTSGRTYEALIAARRRRARMDLYHSALVVHLDGVDFTIEMTPVWPETVGERGVVGEGAVGLAVLGRTRLFRYEVRCWADGTIPDLDAAVDSPRRVSTDDHKARQLVHLVPSFPLSTWGLDEQAAGEMWNSNSLTSWLLARSGHDLSAAHAQPPAHGRAPGWAAGLVVAERAGTAHSSGVDPQTRALALGRVEP